MKNIKIKHHKYKNPRGTSLTEIILAIVLFVVLVPASLYIFLSAQRITGQSYIQQEAANTLSETGDIISFLRNQSFGLLPNGEFYLIRNPGSGSWLVKNDLPDTDDILERYVVISDALRHSDTDDLYLEGDTGPSYSDPDTKKIEISIIWSPDYLPLDEISHVIYITDWQNTFTYS